MQFFTGTYKLQLKFSLFKLPRILLNGYCLYTTWTVIASLINMCQAIAYIPVDMTQNLGVWTVVPADFLRWFDLMKTGAYTSLSLLVIFHVSWFIIENFVFDSVCRLEFLLGEYQIRKLTILDGF